MYNDEEYDQNPGMMDAVSPITSMHNKQPPRSPMITQHKQPSEYQQPIKPGRSQHQIQNQEEEDPDDRPIHVKNSNPYENPYD